MTPRLSALTGCLIAALITPAVPALAQWVPDGVPLCQASGDQSSTRAAPDGGGGAIVVWVDSRSGTQNLYAQRVIANGWLGGGWPADGLRLCTASGTQNNPQVASDGAGGAFAVWQDLRKGGADSDIYVQRVLWNGTIAPGWPAEGIALCDTSSAQSRPQIVADGQGGAIVVWEDLRSNLDTDIYAQRVAADGTRRWTRNGVAVCAAAAGQTNPVCVTDGAAGVLAAWEDTRASAMVSDIYVQRLTSAGAVAPGWPGNGLVVSLSSGLRLAYSPSLASDAAGGAFVAWEDYRSLNGDIYASRVTSDGSLAPGWAANPNGTVVCDATGDQVAPRIIPDGAGGMIGVWEDYRGGSATDLYAQRMDEAGGLVAGWPVAGAAVCTAAGDQAAPRLVSDGAGGTIVTWYDYRNGVLTDIYGQRLASDGAVASGWATDGLVLCSAAGDQQAPAIVPGAAGGALVAWHDRRSGTDYDIYAQYVTNPGTVAPTVDVPAADCVAFRLLEPRPNPAAGPARLGFQLPAPRFVVARIYDLAGRAVRTLEAGRQLPAGDHALIWDGRDDGGAPVTAGVYLVRLAAGSEIQVRRVVRLR